MCDIPYNLTLNGHTKSVRYKSISALTNVLLFMTTLSGHFLLYYHCKQAAYKGRLKVYSKYTVSRYNLGCDEDVKQYILDNRNDGEVITIKAFEKKFDSHYHFGAVEGLNCLEGKDINVVGLPNLDDSIYKLYAMLAGDDISNADMKPMRIKYNGYNFKIQTFDDYLTRKIQLWNLSSLLEQAVGRARLLRYDFEVRVFAHFPIDQAEYM